MRQPDINRVNKAKEHLKAATNLLSNISWTNLTMHQDTIVCKAKEVIWDADSLLDDVLNLNKAQ